jgi:uncharacterized protein (DUF302 family)
MDRCHEDEYMNGLITVASRFSPKETMDLLEAEIRNHHMTVFARIDHARGAAESAMTLRPTELIIFGNARGSTPLMQLAQTIGIDLPLKALVWEDAARKTWLSYNEPVWIARRHSVADPDIAVEGLTTVLTAIANKTTGE